MLYSKCTCCASNKNMLCCKKIHAVLKNYMLCDPGGLETRNENLAFMSMIKWRVVAKINGWYMENSRVSSWASLYSARYAIIWTINLTKSQKPSIVTEISCHFFSTIKVKVEPNDQVVQGQETFAFKSSDYEQERTTTR